MLPVKRSAGVTLWVNLKNKNLLHVGKEARMWGICPGFETQGRHHQKSKTELSVTPQKDWYPSKKIKKTPKFHMIIFFTNWNGLWVPTLGPLGPISFSSCSFRHFVQITDWCTGIAQPLGVDHPLWEILYPPLATNIFKDLKSSVLFLSCRQWILDLTFLPTTGWWWTRITA